MNFSVFSCSHFLSNRKQSVMSQRAQENTAKEGSAVAKPRPIEFGVKEPPLRKENPPQDSSASNSLGNQELDQSFVSSSVRELVRNNNQAPTAYSKERRQDDILSSSTKKLVRSGESASSAGERTRFEFHYMQISDCRYFEKVFKNLRQKLNLAEEATSTRLPMYWSGDHLPFAS